MILITRLFQAELDGERLTDAEVADMVVNIVVGVDDTSTGQIVCTLLTLLEHPDMHRLVARGSRSGAGRDRGDHALRIEHRCGSPVAIEAVDYDGLHFEARRSPVLCTDTANHDPVGYSEPGRFLPSRFEADDVHRLMTFGAGPHYCLGAAFAGMVVQEAVTVVLSLPEPLRLSEPVADLPWTTVLATYPARLPVTCGSRETVRVAVVGVAGMGRAHYFAASSMPEYGSFAICDVVEKVREKAAARLEVPGFADAADLYASGLATRSSWQPRRAPMCRWCATRSPPVCTCIARSRSLPTRPRATHSASRPAPWASWCKSGSSTGSNRRMRTFVR